MNYDKLKDVGHVGKQLTREEIKSYQVKLSKAGVGMIPLDYEQFLMRSNGFYTDSVSLFGICDDNTVEDMLVRNTEKRIKKTGDMIFLGYGVTNYLTYNSSENSYNLLDQNTGEVVGKSPFVEPIIKHLTQAYFSNINKTFQNIPEKSRD